MVVEKLRSAAYQMQWMRLMMICYGMARKKKGMIAVRVRKMKTLTVKTVTVTLVGKVDRI